MISLWTFERESASPFPPPPLTITTTDNNNNREYSGGLLRKKHFLVLDNKTCFTVVSTQTGEMTQLLLNSG